MTGERLWDPASFATEPRPSDRPRLVALLESTGAFSEAETRVALELVDAWLASGVDSGYRFVLARRAGEVWGYTCYGLIPCTASSYDLYWIAVHRDAQGHGLGTALLQETERLIGLLGGTRLYVDTSGRSSYAPTRAFYEGRGYRRAAVLEDFYAPGDAKVVYVKLLG